MLLKDYINEDALAAAIMDGWVVERNHKAFPLALFTYSRKTVREQHWDDVTKRCRGLIVDIETGKILARPFEKFFNYGDATQPETLKENLPTEQPLVTDKLDGSLGILYNYNGNIAIASKGSFHSEHAEWATKWYDEHCMYEGPTTTHAIWPIGYTPVFEMICEEVQKHVVRYDRFNGAMEGLHLLAMIDNETGEELNRERLLGWARRNRVSIATEYSSHTLESSASETLTPAPGRVFYEGYVLSWPRPGQTPLRVKMKTIPFLRLQRLLHHTRPKHILAALAGGQSMQVNDWLCEEAPQFVEFVGKWVTKLQSTFNEIENASHAMFDETLAELGPDATRKDYALKFKEHPYHAVLFGMLPGKDGFRDYKQCIWKLLEPMVHEVGPVSEEDDEE